MWSSARRSHLDGENDLRDCSTMDWWSACDPVSARPRQACESQSGVNLRPCLLSHAVTRQPLHRTSSPPQSMPTVQLVDTTYCSHTISASPLLWLLCPDNGKAPIQLVDHTSRAGITRWSKMHFFPDVPTQRIRGSDSKVFPIRTMGSWTLSAAITYFDMMSSAHPHDVA